MNEIEMCRVCASFTSSSTSTNLFDKTNRCLLSQIKDITGCALRNAKDYPKYICEYCEENLKQAYLLRNRCKETQQYFNSTKYKEFLHKNSDEEIVLEVEADGQEIISVRFADSQDDDGDDILENEEKDTKENIRNIIFEAENKVINPIYNENILRVNEEKTCDDSENNSSDDVTLSEIVKAENLKEFNVGEHTRAPSKKMKRKQAETNVKNNLHLKAKERIKKKEKIVTDKLDFMCDQCGNHFTCRHHFKTHLLRHANDKQFQCELCPAKFFTHSELKRHMRSHTGEKPFECKHCKRSFSDFSTRVKHERIHTNERPFKCPQCDKAFTTSYILKNHMLVHTGERSFKCQICNKAFQRQVHLDVHYRSISHKQMEEKQIPQTD